MAKTFKEIRIYVAPSFPRQEASIQGFSTWLRDYVETCSNNVVITDEIRNLAVGQLFTVTRYEGMDINGYTFYTMTKDKNSVYQNSGVRV
jgi:hypothetical protein